LDCLFDKDLSGLIISGEPSEEELKKAWNKIYTEYVGMMSDGTYNEVLDKILDINEISAKIFFVEKACEFLISEFDLEINRILNEYGLQTQMTEKDSLQERVNKIKMIKARAKTWIVRQQVLEKEFEEIQTTRTKTTEVGRYYFEDALDAISRVRKYPILVNQISVIQFCRALKQMEKDYIKSQSLINNGR
jgi:hypothetical protein